MNPLALIHRAINSPHVRNTLNTGLGALLALALLYVGIQIGLTLDQLAVVWDPSVDQPAVVVAP